MRTALVLGRVLSRGVPLADLVVDEALLLQLLLVVDIAPVEDEGRAHGALEDVEARQAELLPLSHEHQRIGIDSGLVHITAVADAIAQAAACLVHSDRVVDLHTAARLQEALDEHEGRSLAHVVGLGLEGQPPEGHYTPLEVAVEVPQELLEEDTLLPLVHPIHRLEHLHGVACALGRLDERLDVLREARATVAAAWVEELAPDARIAADAAAHHVDIRPDEFAEVGDIVHEGDTCSEHGIGGVLDHLGRSDVGEDDTLALQEEGLVEAAHDLLHARALGTDDHAIGRHEVADGSPFLEEFGVGGDVEGNGHAAAGEFLLDDLLDTLRRTHGHGGLGHEDGVAIDVLTEGAGNLKDVAQVGRPIFVGRRADGGEDDLYVLQAAGEFGGEVQASSLDIAQHHLLEPGLVDRDAALP